MKKKSEQKLNLEIPENWFQNELGNKLQFMDKSGVNGPMHCFNLDEFTNSSSNLSCQFVSAVNGPQLRQVDSIYEREWQPMSEMPF